ncbi:MAG TPA: Zn-dependent alcohol dehydrogenase [Actinomycetota bacterium]|jgi:S-(hydroxymethyl)glutathione dehydrogenase/alcohol dehydrogenase|nr:Zn-dependent alcohol dehydrogenase [Actinomycetota bacterium]
MRAAVLREIPGDLSIEDVDIDSPGPHELLIRTAAAGLCHSDLHFIEGKYPYMLPTVLGHESAGVVEAVGDQVTYVQPGDHVITFLSVFCGECDYCLGGRPTLCQAESRQRAMDEPPRLSQNGSPVYQFINLSSFAEQMLVHEHAVVKIDPEFPLDRAAILGCGVTTGLGAAINTAKVRPGDVVAVIGLGGVGVSAVQGASLAGASRIIAIDRVAAKLELASKLGATDLVDASNSDAVERVLALTGTGVHHAIEAIGLKATAEQAFRMIRPGGTATVIGMIPFGTTIEINGFELLVERKLQGCVMGSSNFRYDIPNYIEMYKQGRLKLDELVSAHIKLDEVNDAFKRLAGAEVTRSVIIFDG